MPFEKLTGLNFAMNEYQKCNQCIMDTTDPNIVFDENGICNHCKHWFKIWETYLDKRPIEEIIHEIKRNANDSFDGILGVSGGVDSSMVAYLAHKHNLRALLIHVNDGWNTEAATKNVEIIKAKTGYKSEEIYLDESEYNDILLAYLKAGVRGLEAPTDHLITAAIHDVMDKYGIKTILSGSNWATEGILPKAWVYNRNDDANIKAIHKEFGTLPLTKLKFIGILKKVWRRKLGGYKIYKLLNHIEYNVKEAKKNLNLEWGWIDYGRKHQENRYTNFVEEFIFPRRFNIDKRLAHYSTLICSGQMTRDEAIELIKEPLASEEKLQKDRQYFLDKLQITDEQFEEFMLQPIRSHKEFATNKRAVQLISVARKILRK